MKIKTPKGWRKGQTIFNFLEWLRVEKGYWQAKRMADPFNIPDDEFDELFEEFLETKEE